MKKKKTMKKKNAENKKEWKQITLTRWANRHRIEYRMICAFLDYYSSRFDLNRCHFSYSALLNNLQIETTFKTSNNNVNIAHIVEISTRQSILSFFSNQFDDAMHVQSFSLRFFFTIFSFSFFFCFLFLLLFLSFSCFCSLCICLSRRKKKNWTGHGWLWEQNAHS